MGLTKVVETGQVEPGWQALSELMSQGWSLTYALPT